MCAKSRKGLDATRKSKVLLRGQRILLVEDMTTDGRSKVNFCNALRDAGASVDHIFVIFYYDIFPDGPEILKDAQVTMHHLATWWDVLRVAKDEGLFDSETLAEVEKYFNDPKAWSRPTVALQKARGNRAMNLRLSSLPSRENH